MIASGILLKFVCFSRHVDVLNSFVFYLNVVIISPLLLCCLFAAHCGCMGLDCNAQCVVW